MSPPAHRAPVARPAAAGARQTPLGRWTLAASNRAPAEARRLLRQAVAPAGLSDSLVETMELLATELVTNAVLHGRSDVGLELHLNGAVRVAVSDENSRIPHPVENDPDALDGRGLLLVSGLSSAWGVEERPIGKAVWFEVCAGS